MKYWCPVCFDFPLKDCPLCCKYHEEKDMIIKPEKYKRTYWDLLTNKEALLALAFIHTFDREAHWQDLADYLGDLSTEAPNFMDLIRVGLRKDFELSYMLYEPEYPFFDEE